MSNIRLSENMIGKKVRCIYKDGYYHPEVGTIGTIVRYDSYDENSSYKVQWPKGSTIGDDRWWAINRCIELVEDDVTNEQKISEMTNKEIWEMLRPKMEKNGLTSIASISHFSASDYCNGLARCEFIPVYAEKDVYNAIALAYKVGYLRAIKGRPFKIGKKKKKGGHWEPVDPENLPKEGTKVRYARECGAYNSDVIKVGDTGVVIWEGMFTPMWFGMKPDNPRNLYYNWLSFDSDIASCLDMWVEDDE